MNTDPQQPVTVPADQAAKQERTVSVHVLTIGKKQVTQTLYRQLVEEHVIDQPTGALKGEIWGWVNVHTGDCDEKRTHLHAIWEQDGQLLRSCCYEQHKELPSYAKKRQDFVSLASAYVGYVALSGGTFPNWKGQAREILHFTVNGRSISLLVEDGIRFLWWVPQRIAELQKELEVYQAEQSAIFTNKIQEIQSQIRDVQQRAQSQHPHESIQRHIHDALYLAGFPGDEGSKETVYARLKELADELNTFERTWQASYETIKNAGQLFIAVSGVWK